MFFIVSNGLVKKPIIGIGCPAHILNNCIQYAIDGLPIDIESIILKIYNYFSIYTVRTKSLKKFCSFVDRCSVQKTFISFNNKMAIIISGY